MSGGGPFMPLFVADYLADTNELTTIEHGAYLLLIMQYWRVGELPNDDHKLARICRLSAHQWKAIRPSIASFFDADWKHARIESELASFRKKSEANTRNGAFGGRAKAAGGKPPRDPDPSEISGPLLKKTEVALNAKPLENNNAVLANATNSQNRLQTPEKLVDSEASASARTSPPKIAFEQLKAKSEKPRSPGQVEAKPEPAQLEPAQVYASPAHELWGEGKRYLTDLGIAPSRAGGLIGKWLQETGDDAAGVLDAIRRAGAHKPHEPISWINRAIPNNRRSNDRGRQRTVCEVGRDYLEKLDRGEDVIDYFPDCRPTDALLG